MGTKGRAYSRNECLIKRYESMYIKKLELLNFQIIKEFNATFDGNVYFITGDNELGKSTLLKAIGVLLTGNRDDVLRNGETKGYAKMVIGDDGEEYRVSLNFTEKNPRGTLTIEQATTGMKTNNVSMLQSIFGYQDFDAVEFSRWSETADGRRKQIEVVKALLPKPVRERIEKIDSDVIALKSERTGVNRDVKTYTAIAKESYAKLEPGDIDKYNTPVDIAELVKEQANAAALEEKAKTVRSALAQRTEQLAEIPNRIANAKANYESSVEELNKQVEAAKKAYELAIENAKAGIESLGESLNAAIDAIEVERKDYETRKANAEKWLAQYEANKPDTNINERLANAETHNRKYALVKDYNDKALQLLDATGKAENLDNNIADLLDERANLIATAKLPIKGLTFTDDGLELNGVPFVPGKVSDSQIMEVAAKLVIVSNPTVKVFRIARGESLGAKRLENIVAIAKKYGYQGFIEQVQRGQNEMLVEEYTEVTE